MRKIITIFLFMIIIIGGYIEKDFFLTWINAGGSVSVIVSILLVAMLVFFPIIPFVVAAGIIGGVFGVWSGSLISLIGAILGALVMFCMARYGFRDWAQQILDKYPRAKQYESYFEKNAFLSILLVRAVPVIPSPVVNILCGLSLVPWITFFSASLIGKIPSILVFTLAGSSFSYSKMTSFLIYGVYYVVILTLTFLYFRKQQLNKR